MENVFKYKGYTGSVEKSVKDICMHGKILFIKDVITYEAETHVLLELAFQDAVNDYIETIEHLEAASQQGPLH